MKKQEGEEEDEENPEDNIKRTSLHTRYTQMGCWVSACALNDAMTECRSWLRHCSTL
jgi:hypothetical protein